ncbi:bifunctional DNA primase/polymerase [Streptomyces sp. NPDC026673]|uniref:bifunctional DNA primase/polymerase n=1 Tax=Streptomyces sp. NPDC026673 TaxID=3155724 RepID=UPI0033CAF7AE
MPPSLAENGRYEQRSGTLTFARWCAAQGWPVLPLAPGRKTPAANCGACRDRRHTHSGCSCITAGRWCHGFRAATTDPGRLDAWWAVDPRFGVGVACGPAGLVVLDVDVHPKPLPERDRLLPGIPIHDQVDLTGLSHGFHTLALLAALRGQPDPCSDEGTLRVRTPSGGLHIWYSADAAYRFLCSTGSSSGRALAWQVDVRAEGGYIIAPGTTTSVGTYTRIGQARVPAPLPEWLANELVRTGHLDIPEPRRPLSPQPVPQRARQAVIAAGGGGRNRAARVLETVLADVTACAQATEGAGFSEKLNRAAYTVGGLAAGGYLNATAAERILMDAALYARPGQARRCAQIIRSGLDAGTRRPLHLEGQTS